MEPLPTPRARRLAALSEPVVVRKLWRSRDRSAAVYVRLLSFGDRNLADVRLWRLDDAGRMEPAEGFAIDIHRLPELAAALVAGHTRAIDLQLAERRGGER